MMTDYTTMHPDVFAAEVRAFVQKHLSEPLSKASAAGEHPNIAVFALMEAAYNIIADNLNDRDEAIVHFQALSDAFLKDLDSTAYREQQSGSTAH